MNAPSAQTQKDPIMITFACTRRCTHGATIEPTIAPPPRSASITPTVVDEAPRLFARTISARIIALNAKFEPATSSTPTRRNG